MDSPTIRAHTIFYQLDTARLVVVITTAAAGFYNGPWKRSGRGEKRKTDKGQYPTPNGQAAAGEQQVSQRMESLHKDKPIIPSSRAHQVPPTTSSITIMCEITRKNSSPAWEERAVCVIRLQMSSRYCTF